MDKKLLAVTVGIILIIAASIAYLLTSSSGNSAVQDMRTQSQNPQEPVQKTAPNESSSAATAGAYVDYNPGIIAKTKGTKLLFFHAPWCPQCRALEADIKKVGVPSSTTIIKVDYDSNQSLRQQYGVTLQTTIVLVDDQGKLVEKFVAYDNPSLQAIKDNLL
jgi:thioredoxin-like negative regulator of GroEL